MHDFGFGVLNAAVVAALSLALASFAGLALGHADAVAFGWSLVTPLAPGLALLVAATAGLLWTSRASRAAYLGGALTLAPLLIGALAPALAGLLHRLTA